MTKLVRIYDWATKKVSSIPACELAPGMIEAEVIGVGRVWIPAVEIKAAAKCRHPPFNESVLKHLRQIKTTLDEVFPKTLKAWEETFRKDLHPEQEIAIWLHIASTFERSMAGKSLSLPERQEYFSVIVVCANSPREQVFEIFQPKVISRQAAEQVVELYHSNDS